MNPSDRQTLRFTRRFPSSAERVFDAWIDPAKGCVLTLTHGQVLPDWASRTKQGWGMLLESLERTLAA